MPCQQISGWQPGEGLPTGAGKQRQPPPHSSSSFPPCPRRGRCSFPCPNSSGARQHRQCGHGFLSSSWGQQLLLSCGAQGMPFPGSSSQGETQEQVVQIRNTSVRDCFKTRLFQASRRTKDVERSAQHHSVDEPCPPTFLPGGKPAHPLHPACSLLSTGTAGGGT